VGENGLKGKRGARVSIVVEEHNPDRINPGKCSPDKCDIVIAPGLRRRASPLKEK